METTLDQGYLYVASGEKYVLEAERSAISLLSHNSQAQICLVTSQNYEGEVFSNVKFLEFSVDGDLRQAGFLFKILGIMESPFNRTIFLDTDTFLCDSCDELFDLLSYFDLLICHDYQEDTYALLDDRPIRGYNTYNSGVIAYSKNRSIMAFFKSWLETYQFNRDKYWGDQPAFMKALLQADIKTYSLQTIYNFRINQFLTISHGNVKILHGRHSDLVGIERIINESTDHRSWDPRAWRCRSWSAKKSFSERIRSGVKFMLRLK
jgi:hypothetical protein